MFLRPASKGVDGDDTPNAFLRTCAVTVSEPFPWFVVDLGNVFEIIGIALVNREQEHSMYFL